MNPLNDPFAHCYRRLDDAEFPDIGKDEVPIAPGGFPFEDLVDSIVQLDAADTLDITELTPADDRFVGKQIRRDGTVLQYPQVKLWRQAVSRIPATVPALFAYLREARERNVCLIRGTPANLDRKRTRRQIATEERGDHGFLDTPTCLLFYDIDGATGSWRDDPAAAVARIVADMGEPWKSASYVWFFSAGHGLKMETVEAVDENNEIKKVKRWSGELDDTKIRVRLAFILDRAISWRQAAMLTDVVTAASGLPLDDSITRTVQPNYVTRPRWDGHPGEDVLGDIPTIGMVGGAVETVTFTTVAPPQTTTPRVRVPKDLEHKARWAAAQGHGLVITEHPDALTAVLAIGSDGRVRQHMMSAIVHLSKANPPKDHISAFDHGLALADILQGMTREHSEPIGAHLAAHGRSWADVAGYLAGMADWARWLIERPGALKRKTIRLEQEEQPDEGTEPDAQAIFDRVAGAFEAFWELESDDNDTRLLIAPTGSRKSTEMRKTAVKLVTEQLGQSSDQSVVILVPRHKLGDEQIKALHLEHPDTPFIAKVWRGRHADDPEIPGKQMCWRSKEARALEEVLLNVESNLCERGRGEKKVRCPFYELCGAQRQQIVRADIWFGAHELLLHPPPKILGIVARVFIDESPLDAFTFGTSSTDEITLDLDALLTPPKWFSFFSLSSEILMDGRSALHQVLAALPVPIDNHQGVPVPRSDLEDFVGYYDAAPVQTGSPFDGVNAALNNGVRYNPKKLIALEWRSKVEPRIRPDMDAEQVEQKLVEAVDNPLVKKMVTLWGLIEGGGLHGLSGRIQIHRGEHGRVIRLTGLKEVAEGWQVPTLICDATGDAELLRAIWPELKCEVEEWQQLPRPASVSVFQCVDRAISKWAVAIEGEGAELARREKAARRLYAAILAKALGYGGQDVGVIVYKSTEEWIEENCHVPDWLHLFHHGAVEGTNELQDVRALFVVGRPLANPEAVTRLTEALFGDYIAGRDYLTIRKGGRIPIAPDAAGNNAAMVDIWKHPDRLAERMRRQITEAGLIQAIGRARAGLRGPGNPLDVHIWTDVPLPELGPVEPVLWDEVGVGLDEMMFATHGVWLENVSHAAKAYAGLMTARGLHQARTRAQGSYIPNNKTTIGNVATLEVVYRLAGARQQTSHGKSLLGLNATRAWLEERLGPLARFEVIGLERDRAAAE
jgi:hypothetical protein